MPALAPTPSRRFLEDFQIIRDLDRPTEERAAAFERLVTTQSAEEEFPFRGLTVAEFAVAVARREIRRAPRSIQYLLEPFDIAHEALVILFTNAHKTVKIVDDRSLAAWLWGATRTLVKKSVRYERRFLRTLLRKQLVAIPSEPFSEAEDQGEEITFSRVEEAVERLTPRLREVARAHLFRNESLASIGRSLGLSPVAARVYWHRARQALRKSLAGTVSRKPQKK